MPYKTKREAQTEGRRIRKILATQIKIKDVKLVVHENMGWHWSLDHRHFGICQVYGGPGYFCLMSPNGHGVGRGAWTDNKTVKDPHKLHALIKHTLCIAKKEVAELQACIDDVEALER